MAYSNPGWVNNSDPYINANNLNDISETLECVPVENGGTGATTAADARQNLGLDDFPINQLVYEHVLPISGGGTGATTLEGAKYNLGINSASSLLADNVFRVYSEEEFYQKYRTVWNSSTEVKSISIPCYIFFDGSRNKVWTDLPEGAPSNTRFHLVTLRHETVSVSTGIVVQFLIPATGFRVYMRKGHAGTYTDWGLLVFDAV